MNKLLIILSIFSPYIAQARVYDLYRSDYAKGAFCQAIGGACAGDTDITNSFFQNPAVLATGKADWNFDGDLGSKSNIEPGMSSDNDVSETQGNGGFAFSSGKFGLGISALVQKDNINSQLIVYDQNGLPLKTKLSSTAKVLKVNLPFARQLSRHFSIGATVSVISHTQDFFLAGATTVANNPSSTGVNLTIGSFLEVNKRFHIGSWLRLPSTLYETSKFTATLSTSTISYLEDFALHYPWIWSTGFTLGNPENAALFLELDVIGSTDNGYLLSYNSLSSALGDKSLTAKGRNIVVEPHIGWRMPISRKMTGHLGSFYETSRWEGLNGRAHVSGGLSYSIGNFLEVIGGFDVAKKYKQIFFTFR